MADARSMERSVDLKQGFLSKLVGFAEKTYHDELGKVEALFIQNAAASRARSNSHLDHEDEVEMRDEEEDDDEERSGSDSEDSEVVELEAGEDVPRLERCVEEVEEDQVDGSFDEVLEDKSIVRTLDALSVYSKHGRLVLLSKLLENPKHLFRNEHITAFGTLLSPLPEDLRDDDADNPNPSDRELVRQLILTKEQAQPKATTTKAARSNAAGIKLPTYNPNVSRAEAFEEARKLKDSTALPLQIGTVQVFALGELVTSGANAKNYHTSNHLFPVGYRSNRLYTSVQDPKAKVTYTSEILEGPQGPVFRVTHEGGFPIFEAASSSAVWLQVLRAVNEKKVSLGMQAKGTAISGPEMMGFANKRIAAVLEGIDGALKCEGYVFRAQRQGNVGSGGGGASGRKRKKSAEKEGEHGSGKSRSKPKSKKSKTKESVDGRGAGRKESLLNTLKKGSADLEIMAKEEAAAILKTLQALAPYTVDFSALFDTGIGKLVNRLRKHQDSQVSSQAKVLKTKWKEANQGDEPVETGAQEKEEIRRHAERLASFVGFAGEAVPEGMTAHAAPTAPRQRLLLRLQRLNTEIPFVSLDAVVDSLVGKRVNKLRKHLDPAVAKLAKKLKAKWKQQIEEEGDGVGERASAGRDPNPTSPGDESVKSPKAAKGEKQHGGEHSSGSESDEKSKKKAKKKKSKKKHKHKRRSTDGSTLAEAERDFNQDVLIKAYKSRKRQRVCLRDIRAISITYGPSHATLWLETSKARYRIAGHRLGLVPSHRYYKAFTQLWDSFQAAALTVLVLKHIDDAASATYDDVLRAILSNAVHCPRPGTVEGALPDETSLDKDKVIGSFEAILDQATRMHSSRKRVLKRFMNTPFMDNLINIAKEKYESAIKKRIESQRKLLRLRTMSEEEKQKEAKRRKEQMQRMVESGNNLPDDLEIVEDDEAISKGAEPRYHLPKNPCGPRPMPIFFDCDWASQDLSALAAALGKWYGTVHGSAADGTSADVPNPPELQVHPVQKFPPAEADLLTFATTHSDELSERRRQVSSNFSSLLSLWLTLRHCRSLLPASLSPLLEDFFDFRKTLLLAQVAPLCEGLLHLLLSEEPGQNGSSTSAPASFTGVSTRRSGLSAKALGGVGQEDRTPAYVYNGDELWPPPVRLLSGLTWTEVCRRAMLQEVMQEVQRMGAREVQRVHGVALRDLRAAPDLLSRCDSLLTRLMENPLATPFCVPVDPINHNAPNYLEIIQRPMDLGTVQTRLRSGHYDVANRPDGVRYDERIVVGGVDAEDEEEEEDAEEEDAEEEEEDAGGERKKSAKTAAMEQKKAEREMRKAKELARDEVYYKHDCKGGGHEGFAADVRQVWRNCETFNNYRTKIYQDSWKLKNQFAKMYQSQVLAFAYVHAPETNAAGSSAVNAKATKVDENAVGQLMVKLREAVDVSALPFSLTLDVLHWLVAKVLETSAARSLVQKNADLMRQIEREELKRLQEEKRNEGNTEQSQNEERLEEYHRKVEAHGIRLDPVGLDRHHNRYWLVPSLIESSGLVLVEHAASRQWGYYDRFSDIQKLLSSFDLRGKRENALARTLRQAWLKLLQKHMVKQEKERESGLNRLAGIRDEAQLAREEAAVEAEIQRAKDELKELENAAVIWGCAKSPEGREYYYHKKTRETTWDIPEALAKAREAKQAVVELEESKATVRVPRSGDDVSIDDNLALALVRRITEYSQDKSVEEDRLRQSEEVAQTLRFKYRCCELLSSVMTLEAVTVGPESKPNLCPNKSEWVGNGQGREEWLEKAEEVKKAISEVESVNNAALLNTILDGVKWLLERLYKCFCGDPYRVSHIKTQEAVVTALRHEYRWNRALQAAKTFGQVGLLERQLALIVKLKETAKVRDHYEDKLHEIQLVTGVRK